MNNLISKTELYRRKFKGCYLEFGLMETIRRIVREVTRPAAKSRRQLDISRIAENLAVGAAPRSLAAVSQLKKMGFAHIIDLRAERKPSDILTYTREVQVQWIPVYDDWRPISPGFFLKLKREINKILASGNGEGLLLCCGAGEHRAPLAGVIGLTTIGYSLEAAIETIQMARPGAEILPVYKLSLIEFLRDHKNDG